MSVTIDSLDIQIRSSAGSAATNIDRLAKSLETLRNNSSLTKVSNNLTKLGTALKDLQVSSSTVGTIKGLAGAMKSMAAVQKANGLNSVLKSLERIPDILKNLDTAVLGEFNIKIRQLAEGLAPLAKEIEKISTGFARLPARISQCVTATNRLTRATRQAEEAEEDHNEALNAKRINLAAAIANLQAYMGVIQQIIQAMTHVIAGAMEWDGIQFRFGQAFGEDAQEVYDWILKINEALGISTQEFMQYSGIYASLLKGFGLEQSKLTDISVGLTELTYDIWAFSNDRYKNLEDAAEAVRSAITGEIEPIRNAGIALTEASMQEYLDTHTQLGVSIEKLTEAQKAEVRYAVMVNSAMQQGIVGTYAREMDTAEGAVRRLTQQLKTLGQAFGSLFIPLLQKVIPWVTAFVDILTDAVHWLAALFGIKIQKIDWSGVNAGATGLENIETGAGDATGALEDTAEAAKKLRDYTMGFDELNVIEPPSDSGSGSGDSGGGAGGAGGGWDGGLELDSLWDQALLDSATKQVDEIKSKVLGFFEEWKTQIAIIAGALAALTIANLLTKLGKALELGDAFLNTMKTIKKLAASAIVITLQYSLMTDFLKKYIDGEGFKEYVKAMLVGALGTWVLYSMWGKAGLVIGLGVMTVASLTAAFEDGKIDSKEEVITLITGLATGIGTLGTAWNTVKPAFKGIKEWLAAVKQNAPEVGKFAAMFPKLSTALSGFGTKISGLFAGLKTGFAAIKAAFTAIGSAVGLSAGWVAVIAAAIVAAVALVIIYWDEIKFFFTDTLPELWDKFVDWLKDICDAAGKWFGQLGKDIGDWFSDAWDWVEKTWKNAGSWFKEKVTEPISKFFSNAWDGIKNVWKKVADWFKEKVTEPTKNFFSDAWDKIKKFFSDAWDKISGVWKKVADWFKDKVIEPVKKFFSNAWDFVVDIWKKAADWFNDKVIQPIKKFFSPIVDWFAEWFGNIWQTVSDVFYNIGVIAKGCWDIIVACWQIAGEWFNTTVVQPVAQFFSDMWTNIKDFAVSAWETVKEFTVSTWEGIKTFFAELPQWFQETIITPVSEFFSNLWTNTKELAIAAWEGIKEIYATISGWIDENIIQPVTEFFKEMWNKVKDLALEAWEGIKETYSTISGWIEEKIITPVSDFFKEMWAKIKELAISAWNGIKDTFSTISGWIKEKIITPVGKFFSELWTGFVDKARNAWNAVKEVFSRVGQFFGDTFREAWQRVVNVFSIAGEIFVNIRDGILSAFKRIVNGIITGINNVVAIPFNGINEALMFLKNLSILDMQPFANLRTISVPTIPLLANGGFVSAGQMFIAREAGAEMVGSIGGRTAVANNDQIVTAVAEGVYSAVVAAMQQGGNSNGSSAVNVYLDGKQIYASVRKTESERGMKLMGSQLGYTY